jgi:hypothetical protein
VFVTKNTFFYYIYIYILQLYFKIYMKSVYIKFGSVSLGFGLRFQNIRCRYPEKSIYYNYILKYIWNQYTLNLDLYPWFSGSEFRIYDTDNRKKSRGEENSVSFAFDLSFVILSSVRPAKSARAPSSHLARFVWSLFGAPWGSHITLWFIW